MRKRTFLMAAGACLAALTLAAPLALADPTGNPPTRVLAGMGSDTTEDVMNQLSNVPPDGSRVIGSYNASGTPNPVQTKIPIAGSDCLLTRAVGSNAGVRALRDERAAAAAANRRPCLDFARSSANTAKSAEFNDTGLTYVPFAGDTVSVVTRFDSTLPQTFTPAQLRSIFTCTGGGTTTNPPTTVPMLPPLTSGTVTFFLQQIGLPGPPVDPFLVSEGGCVREIDLENKGNRMNDRRNIVPHSTGQFFSQYWDFILDEHDRAEIKKINNISPTSATFPFKREVFNVVPTRNIGDAPYSTTFVGGSSAVCSSPDIITRLGFTLLPPGRCGAIDPALQTNGSLGPNPPFPPIN